MTRISIQEARTKIQRYCAYQERSHQEVKTKLYGLGLYSSEVNELLSELITSNFLNEERYARAFAGGKFRMKSWGRVKITYALEAQGLTPACIRAGLSEIPDDDYETTLHRWLEKKSTQINDVENLFVKRDKLAKAAIAKGYEAELVWKKVKMLFPDKK